MADKILSVSIDHVIETLQMNDLRTLKVCFLRQIELLGSSSTTSKYNWAMQLSDILKLINKEALMCDTNPKIWLREKEEALRLFALYLKEQGIVRS